MWQWLPEELFFMPPRCVVGIAEDQHTALRTYLHFKRKVNKGQVIAVLAPYWGQCETSFRSALPPSPPPPPVSMAIPNHLAPIGTLASLQGRTSLLKREVEGVGGEKPGRNVPKRSAAYLPNYGPSNCPGAYQSKQREQPSQSIAKCNSPQKKPPHEPPRRVSDRGFHGDGLEGRWRVDGWTGVSSNPPK